MNLLELGAELLLRDVSGNLSPAGFSNAQVLRFFCPACLKHDVYVWLAGRGGPYVERGWKVAGTCLEDLSLHPSILVLDRCGWHGYVIDGEVRQVT